MNYGISQQDHIACTAAIQRFSAYVDAGRYDDAAALFAPDGVMQRPQERIEGRDALRQSFRSRPAHRLTRHVISNLVLDPVDDNTVRALSYVCVFRHLGTPGEPLHLPVQARIPETLAEYIDELVRVDGAWLIGRRTVRPVFDTF